MGEIIRFPGETGHSRGRPAGAASEPATVIILPVIRIERDPDENSGRRSNSGRRRRRPAN